MIEDLFVATPPPPHPAPSPTRPFLFFENRKIWFRSSFIKTDDAEFWQWSAVCFWPYSVIERHVNILIKGILLPLV